MGQDPFLDTAASLADGTPVDWEAADAAVSSPADRRLLRQLRVVAGVAEVHRSASDETEARPPEPGNVWTTIAAEPVARPHLVPPVRPQTEPLERRESHEQPRPPRTWGHLRVLEPVGEGTFGEVYRAYDTRLSRFVALKLLHTGARSRSTLAKRLLHEGRALARIHHHNVVTVFGAEEHDGRVGLWMELVEGRTLAESVTRDGPYSAREAALIGQDLCRALAAVHGAGLLHRDIKAQNVMRQQGGRVVLMDFGAGELRDRSVPGGRARMTGTPLYLAPEVVAGGRASTRSDIYSVGVLLFFLVTGRFPVQAETIDELRAKHARRAHTHLHDTRPDLPDSFVALVERAIEVDPSRRYASAGALQVGLARALGLDHPPVTTTREADVRPRHRDEAGVVAEQPPRGGLTRVRRRLAAWWSTRVLVTLAIVIALLAIGATAVWWTNRPSSSGMPDAPIVVVRPFEQTGGVPEYLAGTFTEQVHRQLGMLRGGFDVASLDALTGRLAHAEGAEVLRRLGAQFLLDGHMRRDGRTTTVNLELLRAGATLPVWTVSLARANHEMSRLQEEVVRLVAGELGATEPAAPQGEVRRNEEAYDAYLRGRYAFSQRRYDDAIRHLIKARHLQPDFAEAWAELGKVYLWRYWTHGVQQMKNEALEAAKLASGHALSLDPRVPEAHGVLADIAFVHDWDWEAAERAFRRALASNPSDVTARFQFAMFLAARGRTAEAIDQIERGRRLNPLSTETIGYAGMAYYYARDYTRAVIEFRAARALDPTLVPPNVGLCRALRAQGELAAARLACERGADERRSELTDPGLASADREWNSFQAEIAQVLALSEDRAGAEAILTTLLERRSQNPDTVAAYRFAVVHASLGNADEAFLWLDEAFEERFREVQFAGIDPRLDPIRHDPRFATYSFRLGLTPTTSEVNNGR